MSHPFAAAAVPPALFRVAPPVLLAAALLTLVAVLDEWVLLAPSRQRGIACAMTLLAYAAFCGWIFVRRRVAHLAQLPSVGDAAGDADRQILVAFASQTGFAEQLAGRTAKLLRDAGVPVRLEPLGRLQAADFDAVRQALFVVSTTGEGDAPDAVAGFARRVMGTTLELPRLGYGVLALGDSSYDNYCAFGRELESWLHRQGATPLFDTVLVDDGDAGALRHWQHYLGRLSGSTEAVDWSAPDYGRWRLAQRLLLNPGSPGAPAFHLALAPLDQAAAWQAGDIAEIGPRNPPQEVAGLLQRLGLPSQARVQVRGREVALADALEAALLPHGEAACEGLHGRSPQQLVDELRPLPHREYSIASLPADGRFELLVRQTVYPDGRLGLGSGWLTQHADIGAEIAVRIRENPSFHAPDLERPLILIGNGTGLAGLRAHIKARAAAGVHRNWLLFGERTRRDDFFYGEEITAWQRSGVLARIDLAYSRDGGACRYVQDCVAAAADELKRWVEEGAAIYVCGSLTGMASGVAEALERIVGRDALEGMAQIGTYRRDVY